MSSDEIGVLGAVIRRYNRRLELLGSTPLAPVTTDSIDSVNDALAVLPNGDIWIELVQDDLLGRMDSRGALLSPVVLDDASAHLAASGNGLVYALTQLPVLLTKVYAVDSAGAIQWFNSNGPASYTSTAPRNLAVASTGDVWMGDATLGACACQWAYPELTVLDPTSGKMLRKVKLPNTTTSSAGTDLHHLAGGVDGTIWATTQGGFQSWLYQVEPEGILASFPIQGSYNGATTQIRVDAQGDVWAPGINDLDHGAHLFKYSRLNGSVLSDVNMGAGVVGYALGSSGEELFAVTANLSLPNYRLVRVNLSTGVRSARSLEPFISNAIGDGDPTGFIWANVLDQDGDNDGDGATNRQETLAGCSPYDATSRPEGPKVYLDFAQSNNAIILKLSDPDGLLSPTGGLQVPSLSVKIGPFGEVFPVLLQFLTFVQISPDGTQATAFFGALPFTSGAKLTVDASVADKSGAVGWDWQVTPPGEL